MTGQLPDVYTWTVQEPPRAPASPPDAPEIQPAVSRTDVTVDR